MKKLNLFVLMITVVILSFSKPLTVSASGSDEDAWEEQLLDQFEFDEIDDSLRKLFPEEQLDFREILMGLLSGDLTFSFQLLRQLAVDQFSYLLRNSRNSLAHMLTIAVIAAVLNNFSKIFQSRQISEIAFYALYLLMTALTLSSFQTVIQWVSEGLDNLTSFMGAFCPLYFLAVCIAKGSFTATAFYQLVLFLIYGIEIVITSILLPVIHVYMMVRILNDLSEEDYLSKLSELIELAVSWMLKSMVACIIGLNVIQGLITPAIDTVKRSAVARGAQAVPGVGDILGGMAEVALGTAVLVKNGIGMAGAVICIAVCIVPLAQIGGTVLMYKLAAAMIQPVSDRRVVGCIEAVGDGCRLLLRVVYTMALLFLLTIAVVSAVTGNV